jgi:hypothetical protein
MAEAVNAVFARAVDLFYLRQNVARSILRNLGLRAARNCVNLDVGRQCLN